MPKISVIIPVYNGEKTIQETIESVLKQTFEDFELLVIDDGSQDKTLKIVDSIQDSRIKSFSYENGGLSASRNRGIFQACGEYISFIDADDLWTLNKLETQLKTLEENPDSGLVYSWTDYIDQSSQFVYHGRHLSFQGNVYGELLIHNFIENGSNALIRTQVFEEVGDFDESLPSVSDLDMWFRIASRYHFVNVPEVQILYRVSSNSLSANIRRHEICCIKVLSKAFDHAPQSLQHLKGKSFASIYKYLAWKSLQNSTSRLNGMMSIRFMVYYGFYEPFLLKEIKFILIMLAKGVKVAIFPSPN